MNPKTKSLCTLPMPYPEIRVEGENKNYAKMLSIAYAGADGELSAILNYIYSHMAKSLILSAMFSNVLPLSRCAISKRSANLFFFSERIRNFIPQWEGAVILIQELFLV